MKNHSSRRQFLQAGTVVAGGLWAAKMVLLEPFRSLAVTSADAVSAPVRGFTHSLSVMLVDDHRIIRDGIKAILKHSDEFHVSAEAESGPEAVRICKEQRPDLVLMDVGLPGPDGIETTAELVRFDTRMKVIILTMCDDEHSVLRAIRAGARAFVLKKASDGDLMNALRIVAKGGSYLSPHVSDRLLQRIQRGDRDAAMTVPHILTPRETQVLRLVAEGKSSQEIAILLDLRLQTIRSYVKAIGSKLDNRFLGRGGNGTGAHGQDFST